jgi:hypothetical protein
MLVLIRGVPKQGRQFMKKFIASSLSLLGLCLAAQFATAQTGPVSSFNAAGYIKFTVSSGNFAFVQVPFNKFDGTNYKISEIIGTSLPNNSQVSVWDKVNQRYTISTYFQALNIWTPVDPTVERGEGFFVKPAGTVGQNHDFFLYGEVPGATSNITTEKPLISGFNAVGFPYPTETTVENSGLSAATVANDVVFLWDSVNQRYVQVTRTPLPTVPWNPANQVIAPGSGVFLRKVTAPTVPFVASVPYTWPNN